jgi:hypothetical protein
MVFCVFTHWNAESKIANCITAFNKVIHRQELQNRLLDNLVGFKELIIGDGTD